MLKLYTPEYELHPEGKGIWFRFLKDSDLPRVVKLMEQSSADFAMVMVLRQRGGPKAKRSIPDAILNALRTMGVRVLPWAMCAPGEDLEAAEVLAAECYRIGEMWPCCDAEEYGKGPEGNLVDLLHEKCLKVITTSYLEPWKTSPAWKGFLKSDAGWVQIADHRNGRAQKLIKSWQEHFEFVSTVMEPAMSAKLKIKLKDVMYACGTPDGSISIWDEYRLYANPDEVKVIREFEIPGRS